MRRHRCPWSMEPASTSQAAKLFPGPRPLVTRARAPSNILTYRRDVQAVRALPQILPSQRFQHPARHLLLLAQLLVQSPVCQFLRVHLFHIFGCAQLNPPLYLLIYLGACGSAAQFICDDVARCCPDGKILSHECHDGLVHGCQCNYVPTPPTPKPVPAPGPCVASAAGGCGGSTPFICAGTSRCCPGGAAFRAQCGPSFGGGCQCSYPS
jgi:hypothetical protein